MSGIIGVFYLDGRAADCADLQHMTERLALRGPDAGGTWCAGPVGFGHRMLWTTPESLHEPQPLVRSDGQLAITADARIDNRQELIDVLRLGERPSGELGDAELILTAYERWGESCPEQLIGDFVFAIWDGRRRRLFCARDPMGVKPLYYYRSPQMFVFGSAITPMFGLPDMPRRLNEVAVLDYLALIFDDKETTFYQDVFWLRPAHCMSVTLEHIQMRRYWSLDLKRELRLPSDEAYAEAVREMFTECVRCRLRSAYPAGSMLSGGLDSSSIVAVSRQVLKQQNATAPLHTFSAVFPSQAEAYPRMDERTWMDTVVAQGDLEPHFISADSISPIQAAIWWQDDPVSHPNMYLHWVTFEEAQRAGVRVVMSGYDGDTAVGYGLGYLTELARAGRWITLHREIKGLVERRGWSYRSTLWSYGIHSQSPLWMRRAWRAARGTQRSGLVYPQPINPSFANRMQLVERASILAKDELAPPLTEAKIQGFSLEGGLLDFGTRLLDKAGVAFSVECRLPFFDRRFLELAVSIPANQKLQQGMDRVVMRRAMDGVIPSDVQQRHTKQDLRPNVRARLAETDKSILDEVILVRPQEIENYVSISELKNIYYRFLSKPVAASEGDVFALFHAATLSLWLRKANIAS